MFTSGRAGLSQSSIVATRGAPPGAVVAWTTAPTATARICASAVSRRSLAGRDTDAVEREGYAPHAPEAVQEGARGGRHFKIRKNSSEDTTSGLDLINRDSSLRNGEYTSFGSSGFNPSDGFGEDIVSLISSLLDREISSKLRSTFKSSFCTGPNFRANWNK